MFFTLKSVPSGERNHCWRIETWEENFVWMNVWGLNPEDCDYFGCKPPKLR